MSDMYTEVLIKKRTSGMEKLLRAGLIIATVLSLIAGLFLSPIALVLFLILLLVDYIKIPQFDLEYEYLYVNGELDVDRIASKVKRKRMATFSVNNMEMLAPISSHELDHFKRDRAVKVLDFSSGEGNGRYGMALLEDGTKKLVIFEPNEIILKDIRRLSPGKVKS